MCRKVKLQNNKRAAFFQIIVSGSPAELGLNCSVYTQTCNDDVTAPFAACSPPRLGPFFTLFPPFAPLTSLLHHPSASQLCSSTAPAPNPHRTPSSSLLSLALLSSLCLSIRRRREAPQRDCGSFPLPPTLA